MEDELFLMYKRVPLNIYDLLKKVQFLTILGSLHDAGRPVVNQKGLFTFLRVKCIWDKKLKETTGSPHLTTTVAMTPFTIALSH